ncbi:hypothetical protein C8Q80DRAFT_1055530, partial [Daedaleopsis nitida]
PKLPVPTPLSPLAFNILGPRELRKRRESALSRRMTELGFVESPRTPREQAAFPSAPSPDPSTPGPSVKCSPQAAHERNFSLSSVHSEGDAERDVVLLVDCHLDCESDCESDDGHHEQEHEHEHEDEHAHDGPTRSESRQAMLTLFAEPPFKLVPIDEAAATGTDHERHVDIRVEVVTQEAVERTRRRYSRKWIRERKGKRYTAQDFQEVIAELRKLR